MYEREAIPSLWWQVIILSREPLVILENQPQCKKGSCRSLSLALQPVIKTDSAGADGEGKKRNQSSDSWFFYCFPFEIMASRICHPVDSDGGILYILVQESILPPWAVSNHLSRKVTMANILLIYLIWSWKDGWSGFDPALAHLSLCLWSQRDCETQPVVGSVLYHQGSVRTRERLADVKLQPERQGNTFLMLNIWTIFIAGQRWSQPFISWALIKHKDHLLQQVYHYIQFILLFKNNMFVWKPVVFLSSKWWRIRHNRHLSTLGWRRHACIT